MNITIRKIRKRDGSIVKFDPEKITNAIYKAAQAVGGQDRSMAEKLSHKVVVLLEDKYDGHTVPSVEEVQDMVEKVLIESGHAKTAKAYILYRQKRAEIRKAKSLLGIEDELKLTLNAIKVLEKRYLKKDETGRPIETPKEMFRRVAKNIASADAKYGVKEDQIKKTEREFYNTMVNLEFIPNSPTLMNAGRELQQLSACFVLPVDDSMESIFEAIKNTALIHRSGGGTGFSFTRLRPKGDIVRSTSGVASGPISFMKVFNVATEVIKQGGCVVPDTLVPTSKGIVPISRLGPVDAPPDSWHPYNPGRILVETDEGPKESDEFYNHGLSAVRYIQTKNGYSIGTTPQHRLRVIDGGGNYVWKYASDIQPGDWLALKKDTYPEQTTYELPPFNYEAHHNATEIRIPEKTSPELGEFLGYFMGDGAMSTNERGTGRLILTIADSMPSLVGRIGDLTRELFGLKPLPQKKSGDASTNYFFNSTMLVAWLKHIGVDKVSSKEAYVPDIVFRGGPDFARAFVRGLFTADGTVSKDGYPSLTSTSGRLTKQLQQLLLSLGIPSSIRVKTDRSSAFGKSPIYLLRIITHEGLEVFRRDIGFMVEDKNGRLLREIPVSWEFNDIIPNQGRAFEELYAGPGRGCGPNRVPLGADRVLYRDIQHYLPGVAAPRNLTRYRLRNLVEKHEKIRDSPLAWFLVNGQFYDCVEEVKDSESLTLDLSVPDNNTYIANGFISHNTRRGANMGILRVDHPDVLDFIVAKERENSLNNFNISVALTDEFMKALENDEEYDLISPKDKKVVNRLSARRVFDLIVTMAWRNGEPGIIFLDRINEDNPTPAVGRIESTNPCIVGDALVSNEHGLMRMEDIASRFKEGGLGVVTDNRVVAMQMGSMTKGILGTTTHVISKALQTGFKETLRVTTRAGYGLEVTPDHRFMTNEGWIRADDLMPGRHKVLMQSSEGSFNEKRRLPFEVENAYRGRNGRMYNLNLPPEWSYELGFALGWLVGDGWLRSGDKNCRVGFTFSEEDKETLDFLKPILNSWYGGGVEEVERPNGTYHLSYHSKFFVEFFKKLGIKATRADYKEIPGSILTAPRDAVIGFLKGLFTADGTIGLDESNSSAYLRLTAKSRSLLSGVQILLLNLGIFSRIYKRSRAPRQVFPYLTVGGEAKVYTTDGILHELNISRDNIPRFLEVVGFMRDKHKEKVELLKGRDFYGQSFEDEVVSVVPKGKKKVYDLTEPATHSFIANGMVVKNCGEQPLLPYESCNLGSVNLSKMVVRQNGNAKIDYPKLRRTIKTAVHFLDNVIDMNRYPLPQIERITKANRKIGLGVMGWADMLIALGIPYNTEEALKLAEEVMKFMHEEGNKTSQELARERGPFPNFKKSVFKGPPMRNATVTTIAPTGTIGIIAGCSSGIEPLFAVSYVRKNILENGIELIEVNPLFERIAHREDFYSDDLMRKIAAKGSIQNIEEIPRKYRDIFVTAHDITPKDHIRMQAAFQKYTDNAVSKTVNFPHDATTHDVEETYMLAYKLGCKGVTIYRDKSRQEQVLNIAGEPKADNPGKKDSEICETCET